MSKDQSIAQAAETGAEWRQAAEAAEAARRRRDQAIRAAAAAGAGTREIGRAAGIDATAVSRIVRGINSRGNAVPAAAPYA